MKGIEFHRGYVFFEKSKSFYKKVILFAFENWAIKRTVAN